MYIQSGLEIVSEYESVSLLVIYNTTQNSICITYKHVCIFIIGGNNETNIH